MLSNNPPDMTVTLGEVVSSLNNWMADHPVISTEDEARDAKVLIDRAKLGIKDLEDERDRKVRPLNNQVAEINAYYRPAKTLAEKVLNEIRRRITDFIAKEEAKRIKIAEEARKAAEDAEQRAREAELREREALDDAKHGAEVDVAAAAREADEGFADFQRANRDANRAEREAKVRIGGGFTRSLSLRSKETLVVKDAISAINAIGVTPDIEAAIIKGARAFRSMHGELPNGVESIMERSA
jgi:hypothetical protein